MSWAIVGVSDLRPNFSKTKGYNVRVIPSILSRCWTKCIWQGYMETAAWVWMLLTHFSTSFTSWVIWLSKGRPELPAHGHSHPCTKLCCPCLGHSLLSLSANNTRFLEPTPLSLSPSLCPYQLFPNPYNESNQVLPTISSHLNNKSITFYAGMHRVR
jgi:hypothetical protein